MTNQIIELSFKQIDQSATELEVLLVLSDDKFNREQAIRSALNRSCVTEDEDLYV